ncbi:MAG: DUF5723 family protein, partial [Bacteroidales bacterium]|nr:DUF5723 family protein [Bacteroidales bacterium]
MKKILFIILTAILALSVQAQTLRTSYFMDKYTNRHQRNPALTPAWGYINFPALGNIHLDILQTNMKLSDYIYPAANKDNGTVLFLHEDVNSEEFLKKIRKNGESFGFDANINILGFGFFTKNDRFWSFDLNVRAYGGVNIPKDFFAMLKKMDFGVGETYNFKNLNASVRAYTELALGHSRNINEDLRVGGKLKFLMGIADARAMIDDFSIHTTPDVWTINARGTATYLGVEGLGFQTDSTGAIDWKETLKPNSNDIKYVPRGYGAAIDLGVAYNLDKLFGGFLKGFTASFGLTD